MRAAVQVWWFATSEGKTALREACSPVDADGVALRLGKESITKHKGKKVIVAVRLAGPRDLEGEQAEAHARASIRHSTDRRSINCHDGPAAIFPELSLQSLDFSLLDGDDLVCIDALGHRERRV